MSKKAGKGLETTTLRPVPPEEKKSWLSVMLVQAGAQIAIVSLLLGSLLGTSMTLKSALIAGFIGYAVVAALIALVGIIGEELSVPTCVVAQSSFGKRGAQFVIAILFALCMLGWFSMQNTVCGEAFSNFMFEAFGIHFPKLASIIIWGLIMITTAIYGFNSLDWLNKISIPLLLIFCIVACIIAVNRFGSDDILGMGEDQISMLEGIGMTVGFSGFAFAAAPDFTRYQKTRRDTVLSNGIGLAGGGYIMLVIGAILSNIAGEYDITIVLSQLGFPILGMLVLILATWTTNTTNIYCGGIDLVMTFNLKDNMRALISAIMGVVGIIGSIFGWFDNLASFIDMLSIVFMPMAGVFIADFYVICKNKKENWRTSEGLNWRGFVAAIAGMAAVYFLTTGLNGLIGMAISFVIYSIIGRIGVKEGSGESIADIARRYDEQVALANEEA